MVFQDKAMMKEPIDNPQEQFMKSIKLNDELEGTSDFSNESDKTSEETILEYMMKTNVDGNSKV